MPLCSFSRAEESLGRAELYFGVFWRAHARRGRGPFSPQGVQPLLSRQGGSWHETQSSDLSDGTPETTRETRVLPNPKTQSSINPHCISLRLRVWPAL